MKIYIIINILALLLICGCGQNDNQTSSNSNTISPINTPLLDNSIVRGRAVYQVFMSNSTAMSKFIDTIIPKAYAATSSSTVTYLNSASVNFSIDTTNFTPQGMSGYILNLGTISLASLDDNHLKVCGTNSNQKCNKAIIRVYTTGSISGFVNTDDGTYGAPVFAGPLNPTVPIGLTSLNSVEIQVVNIPSNMNRIKLSNFNSPIYGITSDFSNAGSGTYSMTFVVEYALSL